MRVESAMKAVVGVIAALVALDLAALGMFAAQRFLRPPIASGSKAAPSLN
jgi:hypothetical protein